MKIVMLQITLIVAMSATALGAASSWADHHLGGESGDEGFVSIFDGKTLEGWHAVPDGSDSDWSVQDGVIVGEGSADRLAYLVYDDENLKDFELTLSYRFPAEGNSGIEVRARPDPTGKRPFEGYHADLGHVGIGPEVLGAWDLHFGARQEFPGNRGRHLTITEDEEAHYEEISDAINEDEIHAHDWNEVRIAARGNHFEFYINGKIASKFTDNIAEGRLEQGAIGLQIHDEGMRVEFKDIKLKKLKANS